MKKHFLLILLSILLICTTIFFVGCDDTPDNANKNDGGTTQTPNDNNSNGDNTYKFSLSSNLENCTIEGDKINITVSNSTSSFSFINAFSIPETYRWELHYDKACLPNLNIVSKSVNLEYGNNILYALFINKDNTDEIYLYEINVYRICPSAIGTYTSSNYKLNIYDNGNLALFRNDKGYMIGTWTQTDTTICYSVWELDGFEWNNPFYDTVYSDGIDFLGSYYQRIQ